MATLTAYSNETGLPIASCDVATGSAKNARRVPAWFVRQIDGINVSLYCDVKRGPRGRKIVRKGRNHYTRVSE